MSILECSCNTSIQFAGTILFDEILFPSHYTTSLHTSILLITKMGMSYSTAKWVAPVSFVIDFAAQQYGMLATPNMKDIHDANLSFFSPQPFFIAAFFFPQPLFQLGGLYRLYKLDPTKSDAERQELDQLVDFVPYYSVGNLCIAGTLVALSKKSLWS
jgi:hypothetical protein